MSSSFYKRSACRKCTRRQREFISVRACAREAPPAKSVFPPASAAVFIPAGCHWRRTGAPPTRPWCQPVSTRQLWGQELPAFSHLLSPGRVRRKVSFDGGGQIAVMWSWGRRVVVTQRMHVWGHLLKQVRTYILFFFSSSHRFLKPQNRSQSVISNKNNVK